MFKTSIHLTFPLNQEAPPVCRFPPFGLRSPGCCSALIVGRYVSHGNPEKDEVVDPFQDGSDSFGVQQVS